MSAIPGLYRLRDEALSVMTRDHSLLQEQIDCGMISPEEARFSQNKNLVTRALGVDPAVDPEINEFPVLPGDLYLFCSDGLNDMLPDEEIALALQMLAANPALAATQTRSDGQRQRRAGQCIGRCGQGSAGRFEEQVNNNGKADSEHGRSGSQGNSADQGSDHHRPATVQ